MFRYKTVFNYLVLLLLLVLIPKGMYKGQKLTKEVSTNTMATIPEIRAVVPDILFVK